MKKLISLALALFLTACSTTDAYVSRNFMVTGGVKNIGAGREVAILELCRRDPADTRSVEEIGKDPTSAKCSELQLQYALGTTLPRDIATGALPVAIGTGLQGEVQKAGIRLQAKVCADGKCGGGGTQAAAGASSSTNVTVNLGCAQGATCAKLGD